MLSSLREFKIAIEKGLENLNFGERQKLIRLLVEEVEVKGEEVAIKHIILIKPIIELCPKSLRIQTSLLSARSLSLKILVEQ